MSSVDLILDSSNAETQLQNFTRILQNLPATLLEDTADIVEQEMRIEIPVRSGKLQSSVSKEINGTQAVISTNTGYGKAVDEGRRGFEVYPKNARFLRFFYDGQIVYAKLAHPGPAAPNEFTIRTIQNVGNRIISKMNERMTQELSKS